MIGDPKQAIYGFRGGDVTVFRRATAALGTELTLDGVGRPLSLGDKLDRVLAESAAISSIPAAALLNKRPGNRGQL